MTAVERLAMHLALTLKMVQDGVQLRLLQQQVVTVRGLCSEVINDDGDDTRMIHVAQVVPESIAEVLTDDCVVPDDISDIEDWR